MYSKANQKNTVGFVLHAVPYQENSLLVDAITADFGRISFVARGAKSKRSSLKAARKQRLRPARTIRKLNLMPVFGPGPRLGCRPRERTETAALTALAWLVYHMEEL